MNDDTVKNTYRGNAPNRDFGKPRSIDYKGLPDLLSVPLHKRREAGAKGGETFRANRVKVTLAPPPPWEKQDED